eukprot:701983-Pleurochrysis_carterae.AAC.1
MLLNHITTDGLIDRRGAAAVPSRRRCGVATVFALMASDRLAGHRDMLLDSERNLLYSQAIEAAVKDQQKLVTGSQNARSSARVRAIDIGTGSGLLGCLAAKTGASVVAFEVVEDMYHLACNVVEGNGLSDQIEVLCADSVVATTREEMPEGRKICSDG